MQSQTEEIKSKLDIVDLISEYVQLRQSGANFKGLCPFHNEKTPSFMVSREKQFFKCFGCGESGDIFTFLQKIENVDFPEALRMLGEKAGVEIVKQDPKVSSLKSKLLDIHDLATEFYQRELMRPENKIALDYLANKRKLTSEMISGFKLGYAPNSWDSIAKHLKQKGYSDQEIKLSGLVVEKNSGYGYYDRFRHRIMFPIENHFGKVVGFTARALDPEEAAKYINTPQTMLYNKSEVIFGLSRAKEEIKNKNLVVLVEGNMDVIASHLAGVRNIVAVSGTSLTEDQITVIKRFTKNVALSLDTDEAGKRAKKRSIEMFLQNDINVRVIKLPGDFKDPDELIQVEPTLWQQAIKESVSWLENLFVEEVGAKQISDIEEKRKVASAILPWIAKIYDQIVRDHYLKKLADIISIDEQVLRDSLKKYDHDYKQKVLATRKKLNEKQIVAKPAHKVDKLTELTERLLAFLLAERGLLAIEVGSQNESIFQNEHLEFYKKLISFYNKDTDFNITQFRQSLERESNHNLVSLFNSLEIYATAEFIELTSKEKELEFMKAKQDLTHSYLSQKKSDLSHRLKAAESAGDTMLANQLLQQISDLK